METSEVIEQSRPRKGRKQKCAFSKLERKRRQTLDMEFTNNEGNLVSPKVLDENFHCSCRITPKKRLWCTDRLSAERRRLCFDMCWALSNYDAQSAFIAAAVTFSPVQQKMSSTSRNYTRRYCLEDEDVCKDSFIKIF